jgi:hypothetical protein
MPVRTGFKSRYQTTTFAFCDGAGELIAKQEKAPVSDCYFAPSYRRKHGSKDSRSAFLLNRHRYLVTLLSDS